MRNNRGSLSKNWLILTVTIVILGISFRVAHLGDKIFWVDEVATITRVAGYTRSQILEEIQALDIINAADLLHYQQLNSDQTFSDTINALVQSPEHAPLYFILARFWLQLFSDSIVALRSFSVFFGLLCLPAIYYLALVLFKSQTASIISLMFLSISPFYVAYSQEARPYSLWIFLILTSSISFLQALRTKSNFYWIAYLITTIVNLYTSLFSWLILLAQGCYLILFLSKKNRYILKKSLFILLASLVVFIPWVWVIVNHWQQLQANTSWMNESLKLSEKATIWVATILLIFGNLPLSPNLDLVVVVRILLFLLFLLLVTLGLYYLIKKSFFINYQILFAVTGINLLVLFTLIKLFNSNLSIKTILDPIPAIGITTAFGLLFLVIYSLIFLINKNPQISKYLVLSLGSLPTATLIISDLLLQDQRSATPRYFIPAQLAIILIVSYLLSYKIDLFSPIAKITLSGLLILGIISCSLTWQDSPQFQKSRNYHNTAIENIINQTANPLIISDSQQIMDLLSLSHNLKPQVAIKLFTANDEISPQYLSDFSQQDIFIFNPNQALLQSIKSQNNLLIKEVYRPALRISGEIYLSLWSVEYF
jgi:uncharacterized membrane protein